MTLRNRMSVESEAVVVGVGRTVDEVVGVEVVACQCQRQQGRGQHEEMTHRHGG